MQTWWNNMAPDLRWCDCVQTKRPLKIKTVCVGGGGHFIKITVDKLPSNSPTEISHWERQLFSLTGPSLCLRKTTLMTLGKAKGGGPWRRGGRTTDTWWGLSEPMAVGTERMQCTREIFYDTMNRKGGQIDTDNRNEERSRYLQRLRSSQLGQ